jgi:hypothetical protein
MIDAGIDDKDVLVDRSLEPQNNKLPFVLLMESYRKANEG